MESYELLAFHPGSEPAIEIEPAPRWRDWMNTTNARNANRCLPLLVANEHGWVIGNPVAFAATWDGRDHPSAIQLSYDDPGAGDRSLAHSHFGSGVLTFSVPFLFRTPPGWNLLARGPANYPKDGACALEGLVETDWSVATFTMNWKLTRPGLEVRFETGEPFCMVVPQERGLLERVRPRYVPFRTEPQLGGEVEAWGRQRRLMLGAKAISERGLGLSEAWDAWDKDYFRGQRPGGSEPFPEHQTTLRLKPFERFQSPEDV
jgi:hypothetical protein